MREAQYNAHMHTLTYFDTRNTSITIPCRTYQCAKFVILMVEKAKNIKQTLVSI